MTELSLEVCRRSERLELWGGVECTVNRLQDSYHDQLKRSGHDCRLADLDLFAELGIKAIRYPLLWERIAPQNPTIADWSWADERMNRIRELGLKPIVGLVHHGSGPRYTDLLDPQFPEKLATYAAAVAQRYPWIEDYTPVNEPLTTARFSGLYGFWYPHGRADSIFVRALVNQCRAIAEAMKAIRKHQPHARLIQTEDLGKTHSSKTLAYQAAFENERRWLPFDLLCGIVSEEHPMHAYLVRNGVHQSELDWFQTNVCTPEIFGFNYYITSERFIDESFEPYQPCGCDDNGQHRYANVDAVRVCADAPQGVEVLLREAWERYHAPMAITEAHLACTREEQLRWFIEIWEAATRLRNQGVDVRAVTAWALLGAYDWSSLVMLDRGDYESGVFDLHGGYPRPTALARMLQALTHNDEFTHPVLSSEGWWHRSSRFVAPPVEIQGDTRVHVATPRHRDTRPLLIIGATGTLGHAFARICEQRAITYRLLSRADMDIADVNSVERALESHSPWAVVNTAGYVRVDDAEHDREKCFRENTVGPATLASSCTKRGIQLTTFSSDLVFDGRVRRPYEEPDECKPLNYYGESKAAAEDLVLSLYPDALVIRTSAFFGPWDKFNFVTQTLNALRAGKPVKAATDCLISPTYVPDLVNATLDLIIDAEKGVWHLSNEGAVSWAELAQWAAVLAGLKPAAVMECQTKDLNLKAPRPSYSVLRSRRGMLLRKLESALHAFIEVYDRNFVQSAVECG
jgi:dTDP-4-dehydrorhamnose reductase